MSGWLTMLCKPDRFRAINTPDLDAGAMLEKGLDRLPAHCKRLRLS